MKHEVIEFDGNKYYRKPNGRYQTGGRIRPVKELHVVIYEKHHKTSIPKGHDIHHIDGNPENNDISNLQMLTRSEHWRIHHLGKKLSTNTSGFVNVSFNKKNNKYVAHISINGKRKHLGYFNTPEEAAISYNSAAVEHYKEFAYLNKI